MAWQTLKYQLTGDAPLIMHNGLMADPGYRYTKEMKAISSKGKKTDADHEEMARIEFYGGLYMTQDGPIIPLHVIESVVVAGAKKTKEGPKAKSGVFCLKDARLEYAGPRTAAELWAANNFRFSALVRVTTSRIVRTRPIFKEWSAVVELSIEDTVVSPNSVDTWMSAAGTQVGIGDWRPQHGRFSATRI